MKILLLALLCSVSAWAQTPNCPTSASWTHQTGGAGAGGCGVGLVGDPSSDWAVSGSGGITSIAPSAVTMIASGATHNVVSMIYQTALNVQAFTSTFTFQPDGLCFAFVLQNNNNPNVDGGSKNMIGGAGGECAIYQGFGTLPPSPTFLWAIALDGYSPLTQSGSYTYSSAQMYQSLQPPFIPAGSEYISVYPTTKLSTSPVPLNASNTAGAGSSDVFSATIIYDGSTVTLNMYDVTASGTCTPVTSGSCYHQTYSNVSIPSIVGSTTAYLGIMGSTGTANSTPLILDSMSYTSSAVTGTPSFTAYNANSTYNNGTISAYSPVYSLAPGAYSSAQSVSMTTTGTPHNYICYLIASAGSTPTYYPQPDNNGGCAKGTLYSSAVTLTSSSDLYAMAGSNTGAFTTPAVSPTGLGPPSTLVKGTYTITGGINPTVISGQTVISGKTVMQ